MPAAQRVNTPKATAEDNKRFFLRESTTYKDAPNIGKYCDCIALIPIHNIYILFRVTLDDVDWDTCS